jgi:serine/threonine-protein kinase RsbW
MADYQTKVRSFNAVYSELEAMSKFVLEAARSYDFDSKTRYNIELSVDEACANIIDHSYKGEGLGTIRITIELHSSALVIILEDKGQSFDPLSVALPDLTSPLELRKERGLGVYTIRKLMDQVRYEFPEPGHNRLVMVKKGNLHQ